VNLGFALVRYNAHVACVMDNASPHCNPLNAKTKLLSTDTLLIKSHEAVSSCLTYTALQMPKLPLNRHLSKAETTVHQLP